MSLQSALPHACVVGAVPQVLAQSVSRQSCIGACRCPLTWALLPSQRPASCFPAGVCWAFLHPVSPPHAYLPLHHLSFLPSLLPQPGDVASPGFTRWSSTFVPCSPNRECLGVLQLFRPTRTGPVPFCGPSELLSWRLQSVLCRRALGAPWGPAE